jgi:hypothetical protein
MKINKQISITIISLFIFFGLVILLQIQHQTKQAEIESKIALVNQKISGYESTTIDRIMNSVVTLPEGNISIGFKNGKAKYTPPSDKKKKESGIVSIGKIYSTKFIPAVLLTDTPRLDVFAEMDVSLDSKGGSVYVAYFNDRGDATIEKSYARLGKYGTVKIDEISVLPMEMNVPNEEYRIDVKYSVSSKIKEVIIPVVDGHFTQSGTKSI